MHLIGVYYRTLQHQPENILPEEFEENIQTSAFTDRVILETGKNNGIPESKPWRIH